MNCLDRLGKEGRGGYDLHLGRILGNVGAVDGIGNDQLRKGAFLYLADSRLVDYRVGEEGMNAARALVQQIVGNIDYRAAACGEVINDKTTLALYVADY